MNWYDFAAAVSELDEEEWETIETIDLPDYLIMDGYLITGRDK